MSQPTSNQMASGQGQWIPAQQAGSAPQANAELADFLLGLAVITRIGADKSTSDVFNAGATIEILREAASRLRGIDSAKGAIDLYDDVMRKKQEMVRYLDDLNRARADIKLRIDPQYWYDANKSATASPRRPADANNVIPIDPRAINSSDPSGW